MILASYRSYVNIFDQQCLSDPMYVLCLIEDQLECKVIIQSEHKRRVMYHFS
jgi:hypothetical protein